MGPRLKLLQQTHVLYGNHRLVGECLHERDLLVSERVDLQLVDGDDPKEVGALDHRDHEHGPKAVYLPRPIGVLRVGEDVLDMHRSALKCGPPRGSVPSRGDRITLDELSELW